MEIRTHNIIDQGLCGRPLEVKNGFSRVEMETTSNMAVDEKGLVHGGFIFGLADHAAMIAVNHPNVVLAAAETRFLKPVTAGQKIVAEARIVTENGKKQVVEVQVKRKNETVFTGSFTCFVLQAHVLEI